MSADPFIIDGPCLWSFSGGRTSGYMLWRALQAYGGKLPDDHHVTFANTGKERPETLRFVNECASRWGVRVVWLEWRNDRTCFDVVGFNSACRNGQPFDALIEKKGGRLPNGRERWCTQFLKVKPMLAYMESLGLKPGEFTECIGIRDDEPKRIADIFDRKENAKRLIRLPLSKANITKPDVMRFWLGEAARFPSSDLPQGFDLGLNPWDGNCDLCFLKGRGLRKRIIRDNPSVALWWTEKEMRAGGRFDNRDSVFGLTREVRQSPTFFEDPADEEYDTECGLYTCGEAA